MEDKDNDIMFSTNVYHTKNQQEKKLQDTFVVEKTEIHGNEKKKSFIVSMFLFSIKLLLYMLIMVSAAWVVFLIFFVSSESVVVPNVVGQDLVVAMLELQEKKLKTEIIELESDNPEDRGKVLSQDPKHGINVKQHRTIKLTISKGGMVESIPNFVGIMLKDIYEDYDNTFNGLGRYFDIYSVNKVFDESFPGTVLGQDPPSNTLLRSSFTDVRLVVSRGNKEDKNIFSDVLGLPFTEVFSFIQEHSPQFEFYFVENDSLILDSEKESKQLVAGTILDQIPIAGESVHSESSLYIGLRKNTITVQEPIVSIEESNSTDIGDTSKAYEVKLLMIPLSEIEPKHMITIYVQFDNGGEKQMYIQFESTGGELRIPYYVMPDATFFVHRFGKEVWSYTIRNNK